MSVTLEGENDRPTATIRRRVRPGLHIFAEASQVREEFGRQDKVEFSFGGHVDFQDPNDLGATLFQRLTATSVGPLFEAPRYHSGGIVRRIRSGWLFSGTMTILPTRGHRRPVEVRLAVNPTRFAAYAARFNVVSVAELGQYAAQELLRDDPSQKAALGQQTLDGDQNFIPYSPWITAVSRNWSDLVSLYLSAIKQVIETDFAERAFALPNGDVTLTLHDPCGVPLTLTRVETHWEFQVSDALLAFAGMERWLTAAAPSVVQTQRIDFRLEQERAARWIKFEARGGVEIAAYAKARTRLRLEVRHYGRGRHSIGQGLSPALQFSSTTTLLERLVRLREDAVGRVNLLLGRVQLRQLVHPVDTGDAFAKVLSEVSRACASRRQQLLPLIFSQLVASSSVDTARSGNLFNACEVLCRSGILQRATVVARSRSARFLLREPYRSAVDGFRSFLAAQAEAAADAPAG